MTLDELRKSFRATLNRRDITPSQVDAWLQQSIQRAQRLLRVPASEKIVRVEVGADYDYLDIPGDYLKLTSISVCGDELEKADQTTVMRYARHEGHSRYYCRDGGHFVLGPRPRSGDYIDITYTANAPELAKDTDSNWMSEIAPDMILHGALRIAFLHFQDIRSDVHEGEFLKSIADLNRMALEDELINATVTPAYCFNFDD